MTDKGRVSRFYDRIAKFYPLIDLGLRPYKKYLKKELAMLPAGKLIDIGSGHGAMFGLNLKHHITGIDTSNKMLSIARRKHPGAILKEMSANNLAFENETFDYAVMAHVISTLDVESSLSEVKRVLKPKGNLFILNHFSPKGILGLPSKLFSLFSSWFAFSSGLKLEDIANNGHFENVKVLRADKLGFYKLLVLTKK